MIDAMTGKYFIYPLRIHIDDTDFSGSVYHTNYLKFMERARSEWMEELGFGIAWQRKYQVFFVVHSAQIQFLKPGRVHEMVEVVSSITKIRPASMVFDQYLRLIDSPDKILSQAEIKIACVNAYMQPCAIPELSTITRRLLP